MERIDLKKKKNFWLASSWLMLSILCATAGENVKIKQNNSLTIFDMDKKYPKKILNFTELTYIPLETTNEVLVDRSRGLSYVSDNRIVLKPNLP